MADKKKPATTDLSDLGIALPPVPTIAAGNQRQPLGPGNQALAEQGAYLQAQGRPRDPNFTPYLTDDEWMPAYSMSTEDRDRLKARMNAAGLYGTSGYSSGSWTNQDANAYKTVLESANAMGVRDANVVIDNLAESAKKSPRVQGPRAPLVSRYSDPEAVRQVIRSTALDLTGMRLSDDEERRIMEAYKSYQLGAQASEYNAGAGGGSVVDPMSAQQFAQGQIEGTHSADVAAVRYAEGVDKILSAHRSVPKVDLYGGQG